MVLALLAQYLVVHVLGYHIHWKTVTLLCSMPYALAFVITYTCPESPFWLVQRRRFPESEEVFYKLRGTNELAISEIKELMRAQKTTSTNEITLLYKIVEIAKKFKRRNFLKPMLIFVVAGILLAASSRHVVPSFATQIIVKVTDSNADDASQIFYYTLAVDILITVSVLLSIYLSYGSCYSALAWCHVLGLSLWCSHLFLVAKDFLPKGYSAVPTSLFGFFFVFTNLGCAPVPLALLGELLPLEHRAVGVSIAGYLYSSFFTIALKIMPIMLTTIDVYGSFAVLGLCIALSLLVLYFILPETKDKTLLEIEEFFNNGKVTAEGVRSCGKEDVKQMIILSRIES